jgi:tetratricopeptide (TPR) repeat protein
MAERRPAAALALGLALQACGAPAAPPIAAPHHPPPPQVAPAAYAHWLHARVLARAGDFERATEEARQALAAEPADPHLHLELASLHADLGEPERAEHHARLARALGGSAEASLLLVARAYLAALQPGDALFLLSGPPPEDAGEAWYQARFEAAWRMADDEASVRAARATIEAAPDSPRGWQHLAAAHQRQRRWVEEAHARAEVMQRGTPTPRDGELHVQAWLHADQPAPALAAADACLERFRDHIPCRVGRLAALDRLQGASTAWDDLAPEVQHDLDRLAGLTGSNRGLVQAAAEQLRTWCRPALSRALAESLIATRSRNIATLTHAAWLIHQQGDIDRAHEVMFQVLEVDPANFDALNFIGYDWADRGIRLEEAESLLRRAVSLRPEDANIRDSLAWALHRLGRWDEAIPLQESAVRDLPCQAVLMDHLGDMYHAVGRSEEAVATWEAALDCIRRGEDTLRRQLRQKVDALRATGP